MVQLSCSMGAGMVQPCTSSGADHGGAEGYSQHTTSHRYYPNTGYYQQTKEDSNASVDGFPLDVEDYLRETVRGRINKYNCEGTRKQARSTSFQNISEGYPIESEGSACNTKNIKTISDIIYQSNGNSYQGQSDSFQSTSQHYQTTNQIYKPIGEGYPTVTKGFQPKSNGYQEAGGNIYQSPIEAYQSQYPNRTQSSEAPHLYQQFQVSCRPCLL